jgi:hypothetical protein
MLHSIELSTNPEDVKEGWKCVVKENKAKED